MFQQFRYDLFISEYIIWSDARLPGIPAFAPDDPFCGGLNIGTGVYNTGALPAQLQGYRREVGRGHFKDLTAYGDASRKENMIEAVRHDFRYYGSAVSRYRCHMFGREGVGDHFNHHGFCGGRQF